jgi:hypothetical protein
MGGKLTLASLEYSGARIHMMAVFLFHFEQYLADIWRTSDELKSPADGLQLKLHQTLAFIGRDQPNIGSDLPSYAHRGGRCGEVGICFNLLQCWETRVR